MDILILSNIPTDRAPLRVPRSTTFLFFTLCTHQRSDKDTMTSTQQQQQLQQQDNNDNDDNIYRYLVVDSGPIIRLATVSSLWQKAASYYTVPAVLQEIRDSKARQHLEQLLPLFDIQTRQASPEGIQAVVEFSRLTGDYHSLSAVDVQVLGLLYDLEREATGGDMSHVRTTPKRQLGQKIQMLSTTNTSEQQKQTQSNSNDEQQQQQQPDAEQEYDIVVEEDDDDDSSDDDNDDEREESTKCKLEMKTADFNNNKQKEPPTGKPKTWAMLVNPSQSSSTNLPSVTRAQQENDTPTPFKISKQAVTTTFGNMKLSGSLSSSSSKETFDKCLGGQFSDAEEDDTDDDNEDNDDDEYEYDPDKDISDEECDVYICDPGEIKPSDNAAAPAAPDRALSSLQEDLKSEFPSLAAASLVPYNEESDNDDDESKQVNKADNDNKEEERKLKSLQPISKSGKRYNSFRNYGNLLKPTKPVERVPAVEEKKQENETQKFEKTAKDAEENKNKNESRIMGGLSLAGQDIDVEDDGEGWITCTKDIKAMKAVGALNPATNPNNLDGNGAGNERQGPPNSQRAACATTDFAMQNVILQMNLELLSVDGVKVRKLKSWVTRCGACFKVYTSTENQGPLGKRLFCERCGSDMMQRVAASVDGKTGRLRLHLSKKYKHNLRGTKFSLPKPGTGNRFQGDLLLREDQLMMGAWNQKVKMRSGGKAKSAAQSMFGRDIASNVGCHAQSMNTDDIRVGFGRRNPNAVKGRERRGKKKKSSNKACGLRRY